MVAHKSVTGEKGFTLLEIMAVILIIGLALGGVALAINSGGPEKEVEENIEKFVGVMTLAGEKSILSGKVIGIVVEPPQWQAKDKRDYEQLGWRYRWVTRAKESFVDADSDREYSRIVWQTVEDIPSASLSKDVTLEVKIDDEEWDWEEISELEEERNRPIITFSPSGDISDFSIAVVAKHDKELRQHIEVSEYGDVVWRELQEYRESLREK